MTKGPLRHDRGGPLFCKGPRNNGASVSRDASQNEYFSDTRPRESPFQVFHRRELPSVEP